MTFEPAASLILLCYNQQDTVGSAVQSLLEQDCAPVEIILSDDASRDDTFKIVEALARDYDGPHKVIARRNSENLGVNKHIELAISLASNDLMIWTSGDDINALDRARKTIEAHHETGAKLIYSDARTIAWDGTPGTNAHRQALLYGEYNLADAAVSFALYLGATAAWHKDLYHKFGGFPPEKAYEDLILGFRAMLEDSLHFVPEELVTYREGVGVSSKLTGGNNTLENGARRVAFLKVRINVLQQRLTDAQTFGLASDHSICKAIRALRNRYQMRLLYYEGNKATHIRQPVRLAHALLSEWLRDRRKR